MVSYNVSSIFEVVIFKAIPELTRDEFDALLPHVSPDKQERIKKFYFFQDARNCLLGDIISRIELCRITGISNNQLEFSTNKYGKPLLISRYNIHYNISHAGHYVALAVSDEPIGIDIELIKIVDMRMAERFFKPDEVAYIMEKESTHRFFEVWTKKESRIKWEGQGLHIPLNSFNTIDSKEKEEIHYYMIYYDGEAICHVCSKKEKRPSVTVINTDVLFRNIKQLSDFSTPHIFA